MVGLKTAFEPPIIRNVISLSVSTFQYYNLTDLNHARALSGRVVRVRQWSQFI